MCVSYSICCPKYKILERKQVFRLCIAAFQRFAYPYNPTWNLVSRAQTFSSLVKVGGRTKHANKQVYVKVNNGSN